MWPLVQKPSLHPQVILEDPLIDRCYKWMSMVFVPMIVLYVILSTSPTNWEPVETDIYDIQSTRMDPEELRNQPGKALDLEYCKAPERFACDWYGHKVNASGCSALLQWSDFMTRIVYPDGQGMFFPTMLGQKLLRRQCNASDCEQSTEDESSQMYLPRANSYGKVFFKVRPHLPGWPWAGINGPICHLPGVNDPNHLGLTDCLIQFTFNNITRTLDGTLGVVPCLKSIFPLTCAAF